MGKKFDEIYESVVQRYAVGGYLPGDIVKFRPDYKSSACYKAMHTQMRNELEELIHSGLNIKVVQVGDKLSGVSAGNQHKTADQVVITVAGDHGGGRHFGSITVTPEMIDIADAANPTPTVPDQFYRKDNTNWKPEEWKSDGQNITRVTDKGNGKNTPTNIKLAGEGTRLKMDNENMATLYEGINVPKDYNAIYEKVLIEEGLLRRMATKLGGALSRKSLKNTNRTHEFAKSVAYDVGKDISKTFGGDEGMHTQKIYQYILDYIKTLSPQP